MAILMNYTRHSPIHAMDAIHIHAEHCLMALQILLNIYGENLSRTYVAEFMRTRDPISPYLKLHTASSATGFWLGCNLICN